MNVNELIQAIQDIQAERGSEYSTNDSPLERSFSKISQIFNILTGHALKPSDIALIQLILKYVRQYSKPERLHVDSVIDAPSYSLILSELLFYEHKRTNDDVCK